MHYNLILKNKNMKKITKILFIALFITGVSTEMYAQKAEKAEKTEKKEKEAKPLEKPAAVGHAATDDYVNSSFNLYKKNQEITKTLSDAANNAGDLTATKTDLENQSKEVAALLEKSSTVLTEAKTITPKTDSIKAVKAINLATKALNETQKAIPGQLEQIKNQETKK